MTERKPTPPISSTQSPRSLAVGLPSLNHDVSHRQAFGGIYGRPRNIDESLANYWQATLCSLLSQCGREISLTGLPTHSKTEIGDFSITRYGG